jgi:hypothetical protein
VYVNDRQPSIWQEGPAAAGKWGFHQVFAQFRSAAEQWDGKDPIRRLS